MTTIEDIKKLSSKDFQKRIFELKKEMLSFKIQSKVSGAEKPHKKLFVKKEIARFLTFNTQLKKEQGR